MSTAATPRPMPATIASVWRSTLQAQRAFPHGSVSSWGRPRPSRRLLSSWRPWLAAEEAREDHLAGIDGSRVTGDVEHQAVALARRLAQAPSERLGVSTGRLRRPGHDDRGRLGVVVVLVQDADVHDQRHDARVPVGEDLGAVGRRHLTPDGLGAKALAPIGSGEVTSMVARSRAWRMSTAKARARRAPTSGTVVFAVAVTIARVSIARASGTLW